MPSFRVETPHNPYSVVVQRGVGGRLAENLPRAERKVFVVSTKDVWACQGGYFTEGMAGAAFEHIWLPSGEDHKRLEFIESAAEQMVRLGGDRSSLIVAFGGGIVTDMAGFLAAVFMRGIPVVHVPTTLLAQVDAAIGGKTGVNLTVGKNLIGSFHQPLGVYIDPAFLGTLPEREYRAGLFEALKAGAIRSAELFHFFVENREAILAREAGAVDRVIAEAVRIKAEVVSLDELESDLRRILNFGHTFGHALEAETDYARLLHGEAVSFGMRAATRLAEITGCISGADAALMLGTIEAYGPIPALDGVSAENLLARLAHDKKTVRGNVHFVLPCGIGEARVVSGLEPAAVLEAIRFALA